MDLFTRIARSISNAQTFGPVEVSSDGMGLAVCLLFVLILLLLAVILFSLYLKRK